MVYAITGLVSVIIMAILGAYFTGKKSETNSIASKEAEASLKQESTFEKANSDTDKLFDDVKLRDSDKSS